MRWLHRIRRWLGSRRLELLWSTIPVLLAIAAWLVFSVGLWNWKPQEIQARYGILAEQALARKDFETARIASQRLLSLGAEPRAKWLFNLALAKAGLGRDKEASSIFGLVAPLDNPGYLPAHVFIAQALLMKTNLTQQDIKTAEVHLTHAISLDPKFLGANELLAQVYIRAGQWELASERLMEVVSARPETALLLAGVLKARGDLTGARSWAQRAARFHREKIEASKLDLPRNRLAWAEALVMLEDFPAAFSVLEQGWKQSASSDYPVSMGEIAAAWVQAAFKKNPADLEYRITIIQQGLQYAPQNQALLKQLVEVSRLEGPGAEAARNSLARLLAEGKSSAVIHFALGLDSWQQGQSELARKHFALSFEAAPHMPDVANNMAMILAVGDKPELPRALAIIQSVLDKFAANPNFRETRGQILVRLGRWQEAIADLEYALPLVPSTRRTHAALAEAYRGLGSSMLAAQHQKLAE